MKSIEELNPHNLETNQVIDKNLVILYERLEELQDAIGIDLVINIARGFFHQRQNGIDVYLVHIYNDLIRILILLSLPHRTKSLPTGSSERCGKTLSICLLSGSPS